MQAIIFINSTTCRELPCVTFAAKKRMKKKITLSRSASSYLQRKEKEITTAALTALFTAAGATHAQHSNSYTLNSVENITEEEMCRIYNCKEHIYRLSQARVFAGEDIRTIFPAKGDGSMLQLNGEETFAGSSCEVIKFGDMQDIDCGNKELMPKALSLNSTFSNCHALHTIYPINVTGITSISNDTFTGCTALKEIRLNGVQSSMDISEASGITCKSIRYIVENAANSSVITIKVHPAVYMLITGRSTDEREWERLFDDAANKKIVFTTTSFVAHAHKETLYASMGTIENSTLLVRSNDATIDSETIIFA